MKTYVEDQWLRNWFLGGTDYVDYGNSNQLTHSGQDSFAESLGAVWRNMARSRSESLDMYVRFGAIPSSRADAKKLMLASLESSGERWRVVSIRTAETASSGKRQAQQMTAESDAIMEYDFHLVRQ